MKGGSSVIEIVLQPRDRRVFEELRCVGVATAAQIAALAGFASKTRVNARLLKLTRAGYLRRSFLGTISGGRAAAYRLRHDRFARGSRAGHTEHELLVTEVYASLRTWEARAGVKVVGFERGKPALMPASCAIIPDAYLEVSASLGSRAFFLEVDRGTEALPVWMRKAEHYVALATSGRFAEHFGLEQFGVLVVAHSARRANGIRQGVSHVTGKLFYFADLELLTSEGPFAPIWLRPGGDARISLD